MSKQGFWRCTRCCKVVLDAARLSRPDHGWRWKNGRWEHRCGDHYSPALRVDTDQVLAYVTQFFITTQ